MPSSVDILSLPSSGFCPSFRRRALSVAVAGVQARAAPHRLRGGWRRDHPPRRCPFPQGHRLLPRDNRGPRGVSGCSQRHGLAGACPRPGCQWALLLCQARGPQGQLGAPSPGRGPALRTACQVGAAWLSAGSPRLRECVSVSCHPPGGLATQRLQAAAEPLLPPECEGKGEGVGARV